MVLTNKQTDGEPSNNISFPFCLFGTLKIPQNKGNEEKYQRKTYITFNCSEIIPFTGIFKPNRGIKRRSWTDCVVPGGNHAEWTFYVYNCHQRFSTRV